MWPPEHSLITGASSGIGRALAIELARPGVRLTLFGRDADRLADTIEACEHRGAVCASAIIDVRDRQQMAEQLNSVWQKQPIDLVIANAGVSGGSGGDRRAIIDINIGGVLNTVEPMIEPMRARGSGRIAIMASLAAFKSFPNAPLYCASKAAVRSYGEALAAQLGPHGLQVTVLCPGFIETPLTASNPFAMPLIMQPEQAARKLLAGIAKGQTRVAFPKRLYAVSRLLELLPANWASALLAKASANQGLKE